MAHVTMKIKIEVESLYGGDANKEIELTTMLKSTSPVGKKTW